MATAMLLTGAHALSASPPPPANSSVLVGSLLVTYGMIGGGVLLLSLVLLTYVQPAIEKSPMASLAATKIRTVLGNVCCCCPSDAGFAQFLNVIALAVVAFVAAFNLSP